MSTVVPGRSSASIPSMRDEVTSLRQILNEVIEQQKATGEIVRVISQSPADAQPVFDMIAERTHPAWRTSA